MWSQWVFAPCRVCPIWALYEKFSEHFEAREPNTWAEHWASATGSSFCIIRNFFWEFSCDTWTAVKQSTLPSHRKINAGVLFVLYSFTFCTNTNLTELVLHYKKKPLFKLLRCSLNGIIGAATSKFSQPTEVALLMMYYTTEISQLIWNVLRSDKQASLSSIRTLLHGGQ